jgi:uncharacterized protein YdeI (YjbR/CyaY-like superfamily)
MVAHADKPVLHFDTVDEWERWLEAPEHPEGVRLRLRKKNSTAPGFRWIDAVPVALCFGWIDGQAQSDDEDYYLVAFQPRRPQSPWSQINQEHVARLIEEGKMRPGGLAEVERAKADGRWAAAYRMKDAPVPDDLRAALDANPAAAAKFETLNGQNRFGILFRINSVKRAETRERKIAQYVDMLARGETLF